MHQVMHMTSPRTTHGFSTSRRRWKRALDLATIGESHLGGARLHQVRPLLLLLLLLVLCWFVLPFFFFLILSSDYFYFFLWFFLANCHYSLRWATWKLPKHARCYYYRCFDFNYDLTVIKTQEDVTHDLLHHDYSRVFRNWHWTFRYRLAQVFCYCEQCEQSRWGCPKNTGMVKRCRAGRISTPWQNEDGSVPMTCG